MSCRVGGEQLPGGNPILLQVLRAAGGGTCRRKYLPMARLPSRPHLGQVLDLDPSHQVLRLGFKVLVSESLFWVAAFLLLPHHSPWIPTPVGGLGWRQMDATVSSVGPFCLQSTK